MVSVPSFILNRLYKKGSLKATAEGLEFSVENKLGSGYATEMLPVTLDGHAFPLEDTCFFHDGGQEIRFSDVSADQPFTLPMGKGLTIRVCRATLTSGPHKIGMGFVVRGIGPLRFTVTDVV